MGAVETTLEALFPALLVIGGKEYACSGVGGAGLNEFVEGGRVEEGRRYFRVDKGLLAARPAPGTLLVWKDAEGGPKKLRVTRLSREPLA